MKNNKAQFFAIYLVILTIFMCGIMIAIYVYQSNSVGNYLVSPAVLMQLKDKQALFELQEKSLIIESAKSAGWGNSAASVKTKFCEYFTKYEQEQLREFLFTDLVYLGTSQAGNIFQDVDSQRNFCSVNYNFDFVNNKLVVKRAELVKEFKMIAGNTDRINFPIDVKFTYSRTYEISQSDLS